MRPTSACRELHLVPLALGAKEIDHLETLRQGDGCLIVDLAAFHAEGFFRLAGNLFEVVSSLLGKRVEMVLLDDEGAGDDAACLLSHGLELGVPLKCQHADRRSTPRGDSAIHRSRQRP